MAVAVSCPACRAPLKLETAPAPGAAVRCPRCRAVVPLAADDRTQPPPSTQPAEPDVAQTVVRKAPAAHAVPADAPLLAPPQRHDEIGRLGRYRVFGEIGRGGMGIVYRAEEPQLRRQVALKVMLPQFASNPASKARFLREAHAQAAVEHPHVVIIYEAGEYEVGAARTAYLAMPLLKGQTLGQALKQNPRPPLKEVVRIGRQVAEGLSAAHDVGLMHRDIKPGNVWLDGPRRQVKILDFGLARAADAAEGGSVITDAGSRTDVQTDAPLTIQGAVVGTPLYMSPEQGRGEKVDFRTDLYSLGVMLYRMTTGRLPYTGANALAVQVAIETGRLEPPDVVNPNVPPPLAALILRLLARDPADRPPTAEAVANELLAMEALVASAANWAGPPIVVPNDPWGDLHDDDDATAADTAAPVERDPQTARTPRWPLFAVGACAAVVLVAAAIALRPRPKPPAEPLPEPVAQSPEPVKPSAPKEKTKEPIDPTPPAVVRPLDLSALPPLLHFDLSKGSQPDGGPRAAKKDGHEFLYTQTTFQLQSQNGKWWAFVPQKVPSEVAVEVRCRVTSQTGEWMMTPLGCRVVDGWLGFAVTVDHAGTVRLRGRDRDEKSGQRLDQTINHKAVKKQGEWNTMRIVVRGDSFDLYANGEEIAARVRHWGGASDTCAVGVSAAGAVKSMIDCEYIKIWDLSVPPKK